MGLLRDVVMAAALGICAVACDAGDEPVDAAVVPQTATVSVAWKVTDLGGAELPCGQIDAQFVTVSFFRVRTGQGFTDVFDCAGKAGTKVLETGEYLIGLEIADRFGTLAVRPQQRYQISGDTALDEVTFRIAPSGGLVLALDAGLPANCSAGSPITGMSIELYRSSGACEPATLTIEGAGPYPVSCAGPTIAACIEKDRDVTAASLPADEYRIRVVGMQGPTPCWLHDQRYRVRAAGLGRTLVLPLIKTCN